MPRVSSTQNPRLQQAMRLVASSRDRRKAGRCVLEGEHLVSVYLARVGPPELLIVVAEKMDDPALQAIAAQVPPADVLIVPALIFAQLGVLPAAIGVLAVVATPRGEVPASRRFHVLLEDVQDPGNVGTILRTAAAAGVEQVLLSKHCAFAWAPKVLRAAQGAHFLTTIVENVELASWARWFSARGGQVAATVASGGQNLYTSILRAPLAIAIGNEGSGLTQSLLDAVDAQLTIPMPGGMESLNASAAAAITVFEAVRQGVATSST